MQIIFMISTTVFFPFLSHEKGPQITCETKLLKNITNVTTAKNHLEYENQFNFSCKFCDFCEKVYPNLQCFHLYLCS